MSPSCSPSIARKTNPTVPWRIFIAFLAFRILNSSITKTFFQPDEYWQALEPAHELVFGYGYLTWEWQHGLRSAAHPMLFAAFYWVASHVFGITDPDVFVWVPALVQACVAAIGDYYFCVLALRVYMIPSNNNKTNERNQRVLWFASLVTTGSAFNFFCSTRTFSNSLEMVLTTVALAYWPWSPRTIDWQGYRTALVVASISCVFRPTNALIWMFLGLHLLKQSPYRVAVAAWALLILSLTFALNVLLDYWYFGRLVFPIVKFLQFNLVQSLSHFYGTSPWHYYLSQGLPILLIAYLPFTISEFIRSGILTPVSGLVAFTVFVYSLLGHKEFRFIYPILPLLHLKTVNSFLNPLPLLSKVTTKKVFVSLCILNLGVAAFFNTLHQRGVMDVMKYLRNNQNVTSVGFLMPCHSTPWQSHLHQPALKDNVWFLTCEPPIDMTEVERAEYLDVADQFYENPVSFLDTHFPPVVVGDPYTEEGYSYSWPSHLIFFEALEETMTNYLQNSEYTEVSFFL